MRNGTVELARVEHWTNANTGDWSSDNKCGRKLADDLIGRMQREHNPALFGYTAKAISERGIFEGVEVGFFHRMAEHALR